MSPLESSIIPPENRFIPITKQDPKDPSVEKSSGTEKEWAAVKALEGQLTIGRALSRLEQSSTLTAAERTQMADRIERGSWHKILTTLKTGDTVAVIMAPTRPSIKEMNDLLFGPSTTDTIIAQRQKLLKEKLLQSPGMTVLDQSFKTDTVRLKKAGAKEIEHLNRVCAEVNQEMTAVIRDQIDILLKSTVDPYTREQILSARARLLHPEYGGYRPTFGMASVEGQSHSGDYSHIAQAMAFATQAALRAEERTVQQDTEQYGMAFDAGILVAASREAAEIRQRIFDQYHNTVTTIDGRTFPVFVPHKAGWQMNRDVLRSLRKKKFIIPDSARPLFHLLEAYKRKINTLDQVRPYTFEELSGTEKIQGDVSIGESLAHDQAIIDRLRSTALLGTDTVNIADRLRMDFKDRHCTSAAEFHWKALEKNDCTYISLDVLDVGVDLLQEYEELLQQMEGMDSPQGITAFLHTQVMQAGDSVTRRLRDIRQTVREVYASHAASETPPLLLVGGDEITIAINSAQATDQLLMDLQGATNTRVIKTMIGQAERHSAHLASMQSLPPQRVKEHLEAIKRAEKGTAMAKQIESERNTIVSLIEAIPGQSLHRERLLRGLGLDHFAIKQESGTEQFVMVTRRPTGKDIMERSAVTALKRIGAVMGRLRERFGSKGVV